MIENQIYEDTIDLVFCDEPISDLRETYSDEGLDDQSMR
jgi:hypothetical protein